MDKGLVEICQVNMADFVHKPVSLLLSHLRMSRTHSLSAPVVQEEHKGSLSSPFITLKGTCSQGYPLTWDICVHKYPQLQSTFWLIQDSCKMLPLFTFVPRSFSAPVGYAFAAVDSSLPPRCRVRTWLRGILNLCLKKLDKQPLNTVRKASSRKIPTAVFKVNQFGLVTHMFPHIPFLSTEYGGIVNVPVMKFIHPAHLQEFCAAMKTAYTTTYATIKVLWKADPSESTLHDSACWSSSSLSDNPQKGFVMVQMHLYYQPSRHYMCVVSIADREAMLSWMEMEREKSEADHELQHTIPIIDVLDIKNRVPLPASPLLLRGYAQAAACVDFVRTCLPEDLNHKLDEIHDMRQLYSFVSSLLSHAYNHFSHELGAFVYERVFTHKVSRPRSSP
jgi:hypothetical protein